MKLFISVFLLFLCSISNGQEQNYSDGRKVIQVSGMLLTGDSLYPVPMATVYRERDKRGTLTDMVGFFSLSAYEGDTIEFRSLGFIPEDYVVPMDLDDNRHTMVQMIEQDTVLLQTAQVYPWPTNREKFKQEVIYMDLANNDDLVTYNYSALYNYDGMLDAESHQLSSYSSVMNQRYNDMYYAGQNPTTGIFDLIKWAKYVRSRRKSELDKQ